MRPDRRAVLLASLTVLFVFAGCLGADEEPAPGEDPPAAPSVPPAPLVSDFEGLITAGAATPLLSVNDGENYIFPLPATTNATGYVLEVVWEAATPASETLDLWIRVTGAGTVPPNDPTQPLPPAPLHKATGASPLRLAVPVDEVPADEELDILVRAASDPVGVGVNQEFVLYVTVFRDTPYQPEWTAL